ncbi:hypothetical protein GH714_010140 [Hevea brasiliensis]|uniref:Uncharacterized protein n=1 Tax=Hevea brasiliensis TaxID=3981 RepID=A0A6A6KCC3_HEVBR|nr:hypothetical protein GH714_010140 [Hevea brasiliensis]
MRTNGSMKGGQASPMFHTNGKKRGCAFENPEPSSPKVTCIGQVRVKTKKQGRKLRTRSQSQRRGTAATGVLAAQDQRWVHLPLTICEALRAFGAEFNAFYPAAPPVRQARKRRRRRLQDRAMELLWGGVSPVAVQEGEGKGREIELVVGER